MTRRKRSLIRCLTGMAVATWVFQAVGQTAPPPKQRSGVVVKQADIVGQVFVASERLGRRDEPAAHVVIQIRIPENDDLVYQTQTDRTGGYSIPALKVGVYRLLVGGLRLNLLVEEGPSPDDELPKVIITILPKEMLRRTQ